MATSTGVWGIDIGQCALKALRCTLDSDGKMVADAFDFIEYPKILSQPEADPDQLIAEALQQFMSRNDVQGDKVSISVAGQNGLARFFKPPPVDSKKIPDIVKYEARQQIPFALEDVIWDFQRMGGGADVEGVALEAEIGLFAMKRDQVLRCIAPFEEAGLELDVIQLAPLCIYNFVSHSLVTDGPAPEDYNPEDPPESVVVISIGTDTTDIVVTNGFRVWQRNIPLGGNHFTKQLTKELKLTFAKAEHLKRNARQAEGAKAIFQAMRPAFNDLLTEVQRSMNFFHNIDKHAKIKGMVMLGNAVKLPGLKSYLAKNLSYQVIDLDESTWKNSISGPAVLSSPSFKDNIATFGVCYGLCLQGLSQAHLSTNLLPKEIVVQRLIRQKKPWAAAAVSAVMLACAFNYFFYFNNWYKAHDDFADGSFTWAQVVSASDSVVRDSSAYQDAHKSKVDRIAYLDAVAEQVSGNKDRQLLWPEMITAITKALPRTEGLKPDEIPDVKKIPFSKQKELHIEFIETEYYEDLNKWLTDDMWEQYQADRRTLDARFPAETEQPAEDEPEQEGTEDAPKTEVVVEKPVFEGGGWVILIKGYHFFNDKRNLKNSGGEHVRNTLIKALEDGSIELPIEAGDSPKTETFLMQELGIKCVTMTENNRIEWNHKEPNPYYVRVSREVDGGFRQAVDPSDGHGEGPQLPVPDNDDEQANDGEPDTLLAPRHVFKVQFCWQEQPLTARLEKRKAEAEAAADSVDTTGGN